MSLYENLYPDFIKFWEIKPPEFDYIICFMLIAGSLIFIINSVQFIRGNKKLENERIRSEEITSEEVETIIKDAPYFLGKHILVIKENAKGVKELSNSEVNEVIKESIFAPERHLNTIAGGFIFIGLFFTVYGLIEAITTLEEIGSINSASSTKEIMNSIISSFSISFFSTMIGLVLSLLMKFLQWVISNFRAKYHQSLLIFSKNDLVPLYSFEDTEKDLTKLTRTLAKASNSITTSSDAIRSLAEETTISTKEVEKAVKDFSSGISTMTKREESIRDIFNQFGMTLQEIKVSLEKVVDNSNKQEINDSNRNNAISTQLAVLENIYNEQVELTKKSDEVHSQMLENNNKLTKFFGKDFKKIVSDSVNNLTTKHSKMIEDVHSQVSDLSRSLSGSEDKIRGKIDKLEGNINKIANDLKSDYRDLYDLTSNLSDEKNNILKIDKKINQIEKTLKSISAEILSIVNKIDREEDLDIDIQEIKKSLNNVTESVKTIDSMAKDIKDLKIKINKLNASKRSWYERITGTNN